MAITSFRRAVDAALLSEQARPRAATPAAQNKWDLLRELSTARKLFDLSDRDLGVLRALLTFHPALELSGESAVVFPSNQSISDRLSGMPISTLRRHIAKLVAQGMLIRRDSPNGKRYLNRNLGQAFGFDLSPLLYRSAEIAARAEEVRQSEAELAALRQSISLMRRDVESLADYGRFHRPAAADWAGFEALAQQAAAALRRKPVFDDLAPLQLSLQKAVEALKSLLITAEEMQAPTEEMSTKPAENERHLQNSNKEIYESERAPLAAVVDNQTSLEAEPSKDRPTAPLGLVLEYCKEIKLFVTEPMRRWDDFIEAANQVRPMMGIAPELWQKAKSRLGAIEASIVLASMLERFADIRSPGAYLQRLIQKSEMGGFSSGPMLRALARRSSQL